MLGSALIAVQENKGTGIVAESKGLLSAFGEYLIENMKVETPLILNLQLDAVPYLRYARGFRDNKIIPEDRYPAFPYLGTKPNCVYILVPQNARFEDYGWMNSYPTIYYPYSYFYQRAQRMIFIQQKEVFNK